MEKIKLIIISAAVFGFTAYATNPQLWNENAVKSNLTGRVSYQVTEENRAGTKNGTHIDEIHVAPGFTLDLNEYMSVGANYRHVYLRKEGQTYHEDYRPGIDLTFKYPLSGFGMSDRSRFIYRKKSGEDGYFRYRNMFKVAMPWRFTDFRIRPFTSYEFYYDDVSGYSRHDRFAIQWFTVGFDVELLDNVHPSVWYRLTENRNTTEEEWDDGHVIGFSIAFDF